MSSSSHSYQIICSLLGFRKQGFKPLGCGCSREQRMPQFPHRNPRPCLPCPPCPPAPPTLLWPRPSPPIGPTHHTRWASLLMHWPRPPCYLALPLLFWPRPPCSLAPVPPCSLALPALLLWLPSLLLRRGRPSSEGTTPVFSFSLNSLRLQKFQDV